MAVSPVSLPVVWNGDVHPVASGDPARPGHDQQHLMGVGGVRADDAAGRYGQAGGSCRAGELSDARGVQADAAVAGHLVLSAVEGEELHLQSPSRGAQPAPSPAVSCG